MSDEVGRPGPSSDDIDAVLAWTAIRAGRHLERMVSDRLAPLGMTPVQFGVLAYLGSSAGMSQSELARAVQVRPQSAREVVLIMIERGLVRRTGPEGRGRRAAMSLTDDGRALLARTWPVVAGIDAATVGLSPGDRDALNRMLHSVLRSGRVWNDPRSPPSGHTAPTRPQTAPHPQRHHDQVDPDHRPRQG